MQTERGQEKAVYQDRVITVQWQNGANYKHRKDVPPKEMLKINK